MIVTVETALKRFQKINNKWLTALDVYSEEDLVKSPSSKEWSMGKVFAHLYMVNDAVVRNITLIIEGKGEMVARKKSLIVKLIFLFRSLPPLKFKIPSVINPPFQPESKKEIKEKFKLIEDKLTEIIPKVLETDRSQKLKHPRMGFINAREWLAFINIHMKHHLRQKQALENWLKTSRL